MITEYTKVEIPTRSTNCLQELKQISSWSPDKIEELAHELKALSHDDFCKTRYWHLVKEVVKSRALYRCQLCNSDIHLCIHHRTYATKGYEHQNFQDLTCLCSSCHYLFHFKDNPTDKPRRVHSETKPDESKKTQDYWIQQIHNYKTPGGGWTNKQIEALGQQCVNGWIKRATKNGIDEATWKRFVEVSEQEFKLPKYAKMKLEIVPKSSP